MKFTKMQGIGNDYIYVNCMESVPDHLEHLAIRISDRHFGVGSDGLVLICPSTVADFRMRMFNADGSESEMCGNASRCIGKYVYERGLTNKKELLLETNGGIKHLYLNTEGNRVISVRVDMGIPKLNPNEIPVVSPGDMALSVLVPLADRQLIATCVNTGNPHAVFFMEDVEQFPVATIGPEIENHPLFPARVNAEFITVLSRDHLRMRVWERGSGETMACGTGACASLVAGVMTGRCERRSIITLNGGDLEVFWDLDSGSVFQTGPAEFVFDGEFILPAAD